jgi:hypothetical protein
MTYKNTKPAKDLFAAIVSLATAVSLVANLFQGFGPCGSMPIFAMGELRCRLPKLRELFTPAYMVDSH